ncbi:MAG: hypothetical protein ACJASQ_000796 [Crocinitomicaceae bacterium]|jgi:hypothetical protein
MKQVHYSRKTRQLGRLAKELKVALLTKDQSESFIHRLKMKIKALIEQLTGVVSKHQLKGILGSAAVVFGLVFSNSANAQTFSTPVQNPFGITPTPGGTGFIELVDLDNDGDLDILQAGYYGIIEYFENTGTAIAPAFSTSIQNPFGLTTLVQFAIPSAADMDNDGDMDLIFGEYYGNMQYFENTGTASAPAFAAPVMNSFGLTATVDFAIPEIIDLDGDGDLDLIVGEYEGNIQYFENTGTAIAPAFAAPVLNPFNYTPEVGGYIAVPSLADLDQDGDLDLLTGIDNGAFSYYENTGTSSAPSFATPVTNAFGLVAIPDYALPCFGDMDGDGDFDLMVGEQYSNITYFENTFLNASVAELDLNSSVYPNPFVGEITLKSDYAIDKIDIFSISGEIVASFENPAETLDLNHLDNGIYILNAMNGDKIVTIKKITKQ